LRATRRRRLITGTVVQHQYEVVENDGSVTLILAYDWTFAAADLVIAGSPIKPRSGDRIKDHSMAGPSNSSPSDRQTPCSGGSIRRASAARSYQKVG
jgi:hypothetical protein